MKAEHDIREYYEIRQDAPLPRNPMQLHDLATRLYAAWQSFECSRTVDACHNEFAPPLFFHLAMELCDQYWRNPNFRRPEHILWPRLHPNS